MVNCVWYSIVFESEVCLRVCCVCEGVVFGRGRLLQVLFQVICGVCVRWRSVCDS